MLAHSLGTLIIHSSIFLQLHLHHATVEMEWFHDGGLIHFLPNTYFMVEKFQFCALPLFLITQKQ